MGDWRITTLYHLYWSNKLHFRLCNLLYYVIHLWRMGTSRSGAPSPFPYRLVCGKSVHPNLDNTRDPDKKDPVHSKPGEQFSYLRIACNRGNRRVPAILPPSRIARLRTTASVLLVVAAGNVNNLCNPDTNRKNLVLP